MKATWHRLFGCPWPVVGFSIMMNESVGWPCACGRWNSIRVSGFWSSTAAVWKDVTIEHVAEGEPRQEMP